MCMVIFVVKLMNRFLVIFCFIYKKKIRCYLIDCIILDSIQILERNLGKKEWYFMIKQNVEFIYEKIGYCLKVL